MGEEYETVSKHELPSSERRPSCESGRANPTSDGIAIRIHREYLGRPRNFTGYHIWARGYCVSTVGLAEEVIREYIRNQEADEKKQEKLELG